MMEYNITYREKDGGIQVIISYKDSTGRWKQKSKQGFNKKKTAKSYADEMLDKLKEKLELEKSLDAEYMGITFRQFAEIWMKNKRIHSEYGTIRNYNVGLKKFSNLLDMKVDEIGFMHIQEGVNSMVEDGLHPNTIKLHVSKIKTMLKAAVKPYGIISQNPVSDDIIVPEVKEISKIKALNKSELDDLLMRLEPEKDYMISLIAATMGLRLGEIIGLCDADIDIRKSTARVNKQWKILDNDTYGFGKVKSKNSNRTVPIPPHTLKAIIRYIEGRRVTDIHRRLFIDNDTSVISARLLTKYRRLGYEISVHNLRHTYATMLIANGVDFKTIAQFMGDRVETVMSTYAHVTDDMVNRATEKIKSIF